MRRKWALRVAFPVLLLATLGSIACGGRNPDEARHGLYLSAEALKRDSAATRALLETVMADSGQRERLARAILGNEGMRRTLTQALIADSLRKVPGAGVPSSRAPTVIRQ